jgi:hypothetical protein
MPKPKKKPAVSQARKFSKTPTRVYEYGVKEIPENQRKIVSDLIFKSFLLRKTLVRIERNRRSRVRRILKVVAPELEAMERQYDSLGEACLQIHKTKLSGIEKKDRPADVVAELRALRDQQRELSAAIKKSRAEAVKQHFESLDKRWEEAETRALLEAVVARGRIEKGILDGPEAVGLSQEDYDSRVKAAVSAKSTPIFGSALLGPNAKDRQAAKRKVREEMQKEGGEAWRVFRKVKHHAAEQAKRACKRSGLGDKSWVVNAAKKSFATTIFMPKIPRFDRTGSIALQIQEGSEKGVRGLTVGTALRCSDARLKIQVHPEIRLHKPHPDKVAATVSVKLAGRETKAGRGSALYLDLPTVLHRSMPKDAVIKFVYLKVARIGHRMYYRVQFTLESETFGQRPVSSQNGHVALNLGWRVLPNQDIRVATSYDGRESSTITFPAAMLEKDAYKTRLLQACDRIFDAEVRILSQWITTHGINPIVRAALKKAIRSRDDLESLTDEQFTAKLQLLLTKWHDHEKLARVTYALQNAFLPQHRELLRAWNTFRLAKKPAGMTCNAWKRVVGKPDLFVSPEEANVWLSTQGIKGDVERLTFHLTLWVAKDHHLINWARGIEQHLQLHRREIYRRAAHQLSLKYSSVVIEKWDKSKTALTPEVEDQRNLTPQEERANSNRHFVGVSVFAQALKQAFGAEAFFEEDARGITQTHHRCGGQADNVKNSHMTVCTDCGKAFDQDENAARHLWDRHRESLNGPTRPVPSRDSESEEDCAAE